MADTDKHSILRFTAMGQFLGEWGSQGGNDGQFNTPSGVAIGSDGSVYIVDTGNHRIQHFAATGQFLQKWGTYGNSDGQFNQPSGVAVGPDDSIYVADTNNFRIQRFSADGQFAGEWGSFGGGNGQFVKPTSVAVGPDGTVYVADTAIYRIQRFTATGQFLGKWGSFGSDDGYFKGPSGVAVGQDSTVYVADKDNSRVQAFGTSFPNTWRAEFFPNRWLTERPRLISQTAEVDFNWGSDAPDPTFLTDRFSARIQRSLPLTSGTYRFTVQADDGARLWVDGHLMVDRWDGPAGTYSADIALTDGYHPVRLEYNDISGPASVRLSWSGEPTSSISGRVTDGSGNPISGVTIADGAGHTAVTDSSGNYVFSGLAAGTYTITPSKSGYVFSPASRAVSVPPDATAQDFVGTAVALQAKTLSPQLSSSDPLHQVVARGQITTTGTTNVWFEWSDGENLTSYQITGTQVATTGVVTISLHLPVTDSIGVPYYYRIAAGDPDRPVRGDITRTLLLLGQEEYAGRYWAKDLFDWNKYDRLIHLYSHQKGIPAPIVKAIIAQETDALRNDRPELTFLYEPVTVDYRKVHQSGSLPIAPVTYTQYLLPSNPPAQYPYNHFWGVTVPISPETKNLDFVGGCAFPDFLRYNDSRCVGWRQVFSTTNWSPSWPQDLRRYQQLWGLSNPTPPSDADKYPVFAAQYRLAASYGLGQVVYWFHREDRLITGHGPESLYDPVLNIATAADFLATLKQKLAPTLKEPDLNIDKWRSVIVGYNGKASYFRPVKDWFTRVLPFLAPPAFEPEILAPPTELHAAAVWPLVGPGEHEVARMLADVKGNGQLQLVGLSVLVSDPEVGVDVGRLKVFRGVTDGEVEWESDPMEGVLAVGVAFTTTVAGGGAPILSVLWGVGAHGSVLYPFRWDGRTFQTIPAIEQDGQQAFGFFGDAGVDIGEGGIWTGQRDSNQPLNVSHVASYVWEPSTQAFRWMGEVTSRNSVYDLFFPLMSRP